MKRSDLLTTSGRSLAELDQQVLWHPFTQMAEWTPLVIAAGEGNNLIDADGN